jgi:chromosome segregation ATPase
VLYLAEVQKKSTGVFGGGRAELKLLACQRSEQNWTAVPGDEVLPSDEANNYAAGALVLVDLSANRQIQRMQEAGRPLVSILQNFSRLQEKFKTQEEEIEQWKQSLTYQSQELNRREMEMEARREQLQQMEEDYEHLEQQRQELLALREEIDRQKESYDRNRRELEGAWEHLRGEMRRMEEQQASLQQSSSSVLDPEKASALQNLLNQLEGTLPQSNSIREQLNAAFEALAQHQERLGQHWQLLEQQRSQVQQNEYEIEQQSQDLHHRWQEWHKAQETLEQARAELKAQQSALVIKQDYAQMLSVQVQSHDELHQQLYRLADTSDNVKVGLQVDVEALEKMPIEELQNLVQELESDLAKLSSFVESQEEELTLKQQEIDELKARIEAADEFDRLNLENDLADEQDGYQMLYETLVGQRRSLQGRRGILSQHQLILRRRQGLAAPEGQENVIDLGPILSHVEAQRQQQADNLQKLEAQIEQMKAAIHQAEEMITPQVAIQDNKRNELKQVEADLLARRTAAAYLEGRVNLYQELLQPVQDTADELRRKLDEIAAMLSQEASGHQQTIDKMRQVLTQLTSSPELAVS